ncbi:MAG: hypothetical protein FJ121_02910 [Deltaproteobacteria bacterium]|nr:hypothetical protein [Deltaproteobacteria bacterium]
MVSLNLGRSRRRIGQRWGATRAPAGRPGKRGKPSASPFLFRARFRAYAEKLPTALGHADRVEPFRAYCTGLLLPVERKSVEPMAAQLAPGQVSAKHQSLHHFVAKAAWRDDAVMRAVRDYVLPKMQSQGPRLAGIPPSCHPVYCRLRLPGGRAQFFSPSGPDIRSAFTRPQVPEGWQPRGSSPQAGAT